MSRFDCGLLQLAVHVFRKESWDRRAKVEFGVIGHCLNCEFLQVLRRKLSLFSLDHLHERVMSSVRSRFFFIRVDLVFDVFHSLLSLLSRYLFCQINLSDFCF